MQSDAPGDPGSGAPGPSAPGTGSAEPWSEPWSDLARPPLRERALRQALCGEGGWRTLDVVADTGSTNADLLARARAGEAAGAVLVAEHQSAGRGRLGRGWVAPPRSSLAVSVLLRPQVPAAGWSWLPLLAGLAVVDGVTAVAGLAAGLKWPNDVLGPVHGWGSGAPTVDAKVCGVLAEAVGEEAVVLGVGLNVSQTEEELPAQPSALAPPATSLVLAGAASLDRDPLLRAYLRALGSRLARWEEAGGDAGAAGLAAAYREACRTLGQRVRAELPGGRVVSGRAEEVDAAGRLVVAPDGSAGDGAAPAPFALSAADVVHVRGDS